MKSNHYSRLSMKRMQDYRISKTSERIHIRCFGRVTRLIVLRLSKMCCLLLSLFVIGGCTKQLDRNTLEQINKKNIEAGMQSIKSDWRLVNANHDQRGSFLGWTYGPTHCWAGYSAKSIHLNTNSELVWSEDFYYSGRVFDDSETKNNRERIVIQFDYASRTCSIHPITDDKTLEARVPDSIRFQGGNTDEALKLADEILSGWKVKRNN